MGVWLMMLKSSTLSYTLSRAVGLLQATGALAYHPRSGCSVPDSQTEGKWTPLGQTSSGFQLSALTDSLP